MLAAKDITNEELAYHLKKSSTSIAAWCTNRKQPSIPTIFKIAAFLNCDAGELLTPQKDFKLLAQKVRQKALSSPAGKAARSGKRPSRPKK